MVERIPNLIDVIPIDAQGNLGERVLLDSDEVLEAAKHAIEIQKDGEEYEFSYKINGKEVSASDLLVATWVRK